MDLADLGGKRTTLFANIVLEMRTRTPVSLIVEVMEGWRTCNCALLNDSRVWRLHKRRTGLFACRRRDSFGFVTSNTAVNLASCNTVVARKGCDSEHKKLIVPMLSDLGSPSAPGAYLAAALRRVSAAAAQ